MDRVFDRINNTTTFAGEQLLYSQLHQLSKDKVFLKEREKRISFYSNHNKEREDMQYLLCNLGKEKIDFYLPMFMHNLKMQRIPHIWLYRLLRYLVILLIVAALFTQNPIIFSVVGCTFLVNVSIYAIMKSKYEVFFESLSGIIKIIKISRKIVKEEEILDICVPQCVKNNVKLFKRISNMITSLQRKKQAIATGDINAIISDYLIGSMLWDFTQYDNVMRYLNSRTKEFMELYCFIGEIDVCISIASFRQSSKGYCIPEFIEEGKLEIQELYHPLVKEPVKNSFEMTENILLTGSNASGKSTFIKAVAINVILAQSIDTCMASRMRLPDARVITSMAVRDDIIAGESYYIKEIKYLQRIIEASAEKRMVICTIDEILRGTNTSERVAASIAVLKYLNQKNCLVLVASHDLELAMQLKGIYHMLYFCEELRGSDVVFDYILREGISNSRNAIQLLLSIGFPNEIVQEAKELCTL
ncbi:MAG: hypothetical protein ACERKZ_01840 [Lachnotalea sp.]